MLIARDLGRFPSELLSVGRSGSRIVLTARGWLGKFLSFDGVVMDARPEITASEMQEMLGLYLVEKEEQEDATKKS